MVQETKKRSRHPCEHECRDMCFPDKKSADLNSGCVFFFQVSGELFNSICSFLTCGSVNGVIAAAQGIEVLRSKITSISIDSRESHWIGICGVPRSYRLYPSLKSLYLYWPHLTTRATTDASIYGAVFETLRYLPSSCKAVYLTLQTADARLLKVLFDALEEMILQFDCEGLALDMLDVTIRDGITYRAIVSKLVSTRVLLAYRERLSSLSSYIRQVHFSIRKVGLSLKTLDMISGI